MRLISPSGVRVQVSDTKGERLLSQGYKRVGAVTKTVPAPSPVVAPEVPVKAPESAPKRRGRPRKTTTPDND